MKRISTFIILFSIRFTLHAGEYTAIDKKMLLIPDSLTGTTEAIAGYINANFHNDIEKSRAIYIWMATKLEYDIKNLYSINFYATKEEKISKTLTTRKGICDNFSTIFDDVCSKIGIKSYVITGFTKQYGFTDYIPHAWCAAYIDTAWYLFDPTWGSGYITEEGKFYRRVNEKYFMAKPSYLIRSHMPFDFLWQFMNYIITNQEFYDSKVAQVARPYFNYKDSLLLYDKQSRIDRLTSTARRIEANGIKNSMIFDQLQHIKMEIEHDRKSQNANAHNSAVTDYNDGVHHYNTFIHYRNKRFTPEKPDNEIQSMLDSADYKLKESKRKLDSIVNPDPENVEMIDQLKKSIDDISAQLKEQQDWLNKYLSKGKVGRTMMFMK